MASLPELPSPKRPVQEPLSVTLPSPASRFNGAAVSLPPATSHTDASLVQTPKETQPIIQTASTPDVPAPRAAANEPTHPRATDATPAEPSKEVDVYGGTHQVEGEVVGPEGVKRPQDLPTGLPSSSQLPRDEAAERAVEKVITGLDKVIEGHAEELDPTPAEVREDAATLLKGISDGEGPRQTSEIEASESTQVFPKDPGSESSRTPTVDAKSPDPRRPIRGRVPEAGSGSTPVEPPPTPPGAELPSEDLPPEDLAFLKQQERNSNTKTFDRDAFFRTVAEFREYSESLRTKLDANLPTRLEPSSTDAATRKREIAAYEVGGLIRPSTDRLVVLSRHFLKIPQIKHQFDLWNAEKIAKALPEFREGLELLDANDALPSHRSDYFEQVEFLMVDAIENIVDTYPSSVIDDLGVLMSYHAFENLLDSDTRQAIVASSGVPTFTRYLKFVVDDALSKNENLTRRIGDEFLPRKQEGLGRRLMRVPLNSLIHDFEDVFLTGDLALAKQLLEQPGYTGGRCPAMLEKLVYQYAKIIVNYLPHTS